MKLTFGKSLKLWNQETKNVWNQEANKLWNQEAKKLWNQETIFWNQETKKQKTWNQYLFIFKWGNPQHTSWPCLGVIRRAIFMEHIITWMAEKLHRIILLHFELLTFQFAYVRDRNLTFPRILDLWDP